MSSNAFAWRLLAATLLTVALASLVNRASGESQPGQGDEAGGRGAEAEIVWRSERVCGLNCVYVLLKVHGHTPQYEDVLEGWQGSDSVTSLADLNRVARAHGLRCAVGKTSPAGLAALPKPVIAHFDATGDAAKGPDTGHFVLVLDAQPDRLTVMDGTTGVIRPFSREDFERRWSGHVLYRKPLLPELGWPVGLLGVVAGVVLTWAADRGFLRKLVRRPATAGVPETTAGSMPAR